MSQAEGVLGDEQHRLAAALHRVKAAEKQLKEEEERAEQLVSRGVAELAVLLLLPAVLDQLRSQG